MRDDNGDMDDNNKGVRDGDDGRKDDSQRWWRQEASSSGSMKGKKKVNFYCSQLIHK